MTPSNRTHSTPPSTCFLHPSTHQRGIRGPAVPSYQGSKRADEKLREEIIWQTQKHAHSPVQEMEDVHTPQKAGFTASPCRDAGKAVEGRELCGVRCPHPPVLLAFTGRRLMRSIAEVIDCQRSRKQPRSQSRGSFGIPARRLLLKVLADLNGGSL